MITPAAEFRQLINGTRAGARLARRLTLRRLDAWGIPRGSDVSDRAAAIVAELAANAVTHGRVRGRGFELRLILTARRLRVEVSDTRDERIPRRTAAAPDPESEGGRGLLLVEALADGWDVVDRSPGKTVRADVLLTPCDASHLR
ncbi:ATP-binding protein [Streptomyces sp. MI02-7b]|nr:ATP-binding protein [Streptomyces sp. MI02-7b]MDX3074772.1 ATP-binding protein [Streptomyces sp. MI02-7b]